MSNLGLSCSLLQLKNLLKRDPDSYSEEFVQQCEHFHSALALFVQRPTEFSEELADSTLFISQVAYCYSSPANQCSGHVSRFISALMDALRTRSGTVQMHANTRRVLCQALMHLRQKRLVPANEALALIFDVLTHSCPDKALRRQLASFLVFDIRLVNKRHKNIKLNSSLQNYLYGILRESKPNAARIALRIMIELYRRRIWSDAKTVNVVATACFSKNAALLRTALQFFVGTLEEQEAGESDDESGSEQGYEPSHEVVRVQQKLKLAHRVGRKTRKREKRMKRAVDTVKRHEKRESRVQTGVDNGTINLLYDPQGFAEKLLNLLQGNRERFQIRIMVMNLVSRVISVHKLIVLNFYPFIQRFLQPQQTDVTKILVYTAQACHSLVPPDAIESIIRTLSNNFISERNSPEAMAVGLNSVREVCARCPFAMSNELANDLVAYRNYKNKSVSVSARSLLSLLRELNPLVLERRFKGKPTDAMVEAGALVRAQQYGEQLAFDHVPGAECVTLADSDQSDEVMQDEGPESCSASEDSDGQDVSDDNDEQSDALEMDEESGEDDKAAFDSEERDSDEEARDESHSCRSSSRDDRVDAKSSATASSATLSVAQRVARARAVSSTRLLTAADFERIRAHQSGKLARLTVSTRAARIRNDSAADGEAHDSKRSREDSDAEEPEQLVALPQPTSDVVSESKISYLAKLSKEKKKRLQANDDDEEQEKSWKHDKRQNPLASTTNAEKRKKKPFMMMRQKVRQGRRRRTFTDRKRALKQSLQRQLKFSLKR